MNNILNQRWKLNIYIKRYLTILLFSIAISVLLEITVFNISHYCSLNLADVKDIEMNVTGMEHIKENTYAVINEEAYIEMFFPYQKIENIHIDIQPEKRYGRYNNGTGVNLFIADEGNKFYYGLPERVVTHEIEQSQYMNIHGAGEICQVKIVIDPSLAGSNIIIHDISLNASVPFAFSVMRVLICSFLISVVYILIPKKGFYKCMYDNKSNKQKIVTFIVIFILVGMFSILVTQLDSTTPEPSPYELLAKSLAKGQAYLDLQPSQELLALDNPYDTDLRWASDASFYWDYAFYNGRYYVYFGIVPVILFYLPYYLLTGNSLPARVDFYFCSALLVTGIFILIREVINKRFKKIPFILYLLISTTVTNGIGVLYLLLHADFYSEPILFAVTFAVWGLYFWFSSIKLTGELISWRLMLGSLCIACIAGCRPQILMIGLLAFPLFTSYFIVRPIRKEITGKYFINIACFAAPIILVAAGIMYYNYIRFGSIVDFGANYNLTTNDMTKRGFVFGRTGFGLFTYLLQPPNIVAQFPFITKSVLTTEYMGRTISEDMYGGLFANNVLLFSGPLFFIVNQELKSKKLYGITIISIISGLVISIADCQLAGILTRYYADFALFFFLAAVLVILTLLEKAYDRQSNIVYGFTASVCLISLLYNVLFIFNDSNIHEGYMLHQKVLNLLQFWRN